MDDSEGGPHTAEMESTEWQLRARAAGLTQRMLGRLTGRDEKTISMQMRGKWGNGVPQHLITVIVAWEIMSEEQRVHWVLACAGVGEAEDPSDSPERG